MNETVERVADALIERFKEMVAAGSGLPFDQTGVTVPARVIWVCYARAAIAAMPKPSGICQGGPLHGHRYHHPEVEHRLAVDQHTGKCIPGMVSSADPFIKFGTYRFADGIWTWNE